LQPFSTATPAAYSTVQNEADEYLKQGLFDRAIAVLTRGLQNEPENIKYHLSIGKAYNFNNQDEAAIPHFKKYLAKEKNDIEIITLLGECYKKTGEYNRAIEQFEKALSIEPNYDYAKRNLKDTENLILAQKDPAKAQKERYDAGVKNLTEAVKIAKNFLPFGYTNNMGDITVAFNKTAKMGGRANIAQYEHYKRGIAVTDEYLYADPRLTASYIIHEFVHGKDNDPYTSIMEEQDAYRVQAKYWTERVKGVYDPEMDYVQELYKSSAEELDKRVAEIYRLRDPRIQQTSFNHPPSSKSYAAVQNLSAADQPLKAYDIIV
jgi:tetratricopeptide (TPR) repeat protein